MPMQSDADVAKNATIIGETAESRNEAISLLRTDFEINGEKSEGDRSPVEGVDSLPVYIGPSGTEYRGYPPSDLFEFPEIDISYLYFYYLWIDDFGVIHTKIFESEIDGTGYEDLIDIFVEQARSRPWLGSSNLDAVDWNRPAHIAFFLDNEAWELIDLDPLTGASYSLHFSNVVQDGVANSPNQSFFNARNVPLISGDGLQKYLLVENFHIKAGLDYLRRRDLLDRDYPDNYKYDLYYRVGLASSSPKLERLTVIIDPGARNTGP